MLYHLLLNYLKDFQYNYHSYNPISWNSMDNLYYIFVVSRFFENHIDTYLCSTFGLNYIFLPSNLHLESHKICFINIFNSLNLVISLNTFTYTSFISFGTKVLSDKLSKVLQLPLLDKSSKALQLPLHISNLKKA